MNRLTKCGVAAFLVSLLLGLARPAAADEMRGTLLEVYPDIQEFVLVPEGDRSLTFQLDEDAQVLINDEEAALADLRVDDRVTVVYRLEGTLWLAIEVRCERVR